MAERDGWKCGGRDKKTCFIYNNILERVVIVVFVGVVVIVVVV